MGKMGWVSSLCHLPIPFLFDGGDKRPNWESSSPSQGIEEGRDEEMAVKREAGGIKG